MFSILLLVLTADPGEPQRFFREHVKLGAAEIARIQAGQPVAKVLPAPSPDVLHVFGAVFIKSSPDRYLRFARDIGRLRKLPQYLGARELSAVPSLADFEGFALTAEDIESLKKCRPGKCEVQLPVEAMEEFRQSIDWSDSRVMERVNEKARAMALEAVRRYQSGGDAALGAYHDQKQAQGIGEHFASLMGAIGIVDQYLPQLMAGLRRFPAAPLPKGESFFYWERVNFGLKPTLRLNHAVVYRDVDARGTAEVVAIKQLYASHYFQAAIDLSVCVPDAANQGFYLISLRGSKQAGLTGVTGGLLRSVLVDKTRASQESALRAIRAALERGQ